MRSTVIALSLCLSLAHAAAAQMPRLAINDNRVSAGTLKNGLLELNLEITKGMWHPDGDGDAGVDVIALGEAGKRAMVPAPLIRVPLGTRVRARIHNKLDESMMVYGLNNTHALADSIRLQPGETREFTITASKPGNYVYAAWRSFRVASAENPAAGNDMTAGGAFVVDAPGAPQNDRVLVMNMMVDTTRVPRVQGFTSILATINGKSWPHTERFAHDVGDTIVWRVLNASIIPHPMHLHGFYYDVLSRTHRGVDTTYAPNAVRKVVTELLIGGTAMTMRWVPERAGNWLFHCHLTAHTQLHGPVVGAMKASGKHEHDAMHGMSNLMLGIVVRGSVRADAADREKRRLVATQSDSLPGDVVTRFNYSLDGARNDKAAGPVIVIHKDQPTAITVVNQTNEATAVHWHGIELESFSDGVAGFGGHGTRVSPLIAPGDSFTARMTPPRAGTFIYHTHVDELRQQRGGLYGALLVVDPKTYDASSERVILLGSPNDSAAQIGVWFNGEKQPDVFLEAGKTYRLRFIQIMTTRPAMYVALLDPSGKMSEWKLVAKDGADLPAHQSNTGPARQSTSNGETYDVMFTPNVAGTWKLEARANNGNVFGSMMVTVR